MNKLFQFTPLREGRPSVGDTVSDAPIISIHAPPRGATASAITASHTPVNFNSRPSARGDSSLSWQKTGISVISIHAPPRGATGGFCKGGRELRISIHAPPRGATLHQSDMASHSLISIHAPPRGATACNPFQNRPIYFNSRPSARGDGKRYAISANLLFNPYKSAWLNNSATQFVEIILVIFHRIIV